VPELRSFLERNRVEYTWVDVEGDPLVRLLGSPERLDALRLPTVLCPDGEWVEGPEGYEERFATPPAHIAEDEAYLAATRWRCRLAEKLGLATRPSRDLYDPVALRDRSIGDSTSIRVDGLFVLIGGEPLTGGVEGWLRRDEHGFLVTGPDVLAGDAGRLRWPLERAPMLLESSQPGIFVAGDVRHGSSKRVASAVGEGAMAVQLVHRYLAASEGR
jgi:hypothetical protein